MKLAERKEKKKLKGPGSIFKVKLQTQVGRHCPEIGSVYFIFLDKHCQFLER